MEHLKIHEAKELLRKAGYYVEKLWSVEDIIGSYACAEEQAQQVLNKALNLESVMDEIWFAIKFVADDMNLKKLKEDDNR